MKRSMMTNSFCLILAISGTIMRKWICRILRCNIKILRINWALHLDKRDIIGTILYNLGSIQFKMGNYDLSLPFYRKSVFYNAVSQNYLSLSQVYLEMANLFEKTGEHDSSLVYTKKALAVAQQVNYVLGIYNASNLLFKMYDAKNNDSALKYLKLTVINKDSLFSQEKTKQVQNLTFSEQLRE